MLSLIAAAYLQLSTADASTQLYWAEECVKHVDDIGSFSDPLPSMITSDADMDAWSAASQFHDCMSYLGELGRDVHAAAPAIRPLLGHPDVRARAAALQLLGHLGDTDSLPEVREHLDAGDWFETLAAIEAIALLGGAEDIDRLSEFAAGHWLPEVRARAWHVASVRRSNLRRGYDRERGSAPIDTQSHEEQLARRLPELYWHGSQVPEREICPSESYRFRNRVLSRQEALPGPALEETASLAVLSGEFRYTDNGEFGGELIWREGGLEQRLIAANIRALIPLDDRTFIAVSGLAYTGTLYRVISSETGWDVTEISSLPGVPRWAVPMGGGLIGARTSVGFIVASQDAIIGMGQCEPGPLAAPWARRF